MAACKLEWRPAPSLGTHSLPCLGDISPQWPLGALIATLKPLLGITYLLARPPAGRWCMAGRCKIVCHSARHLVCAQMDTWVRCDS